MTLVTLACSQASPIFCSPSICFCVANILNANQKNQKWGRPGNEAKCFIFGTIIQFFSFVNWRSSYRMKVPNQCQTWSTDFHQNQDFTLHHSHLENFSLSSEGNSLNDSSERNCLNDHHVGSSWNCFSKMHHFELFILKQVTAFLMMSTILYCTLGTF